MSCRPKQTPPGAIVADPAAVQREGLARTIKVSEPVLSKEDLKKKEEAKKKDEASKKAATLKREEEERKAAEKKKSDEKKDMVQRIIQEKEAEEAAENAGKGFITELEYMVNRTLSYVFEFYVSAVFMFSEDKKYI